LTDLGDLAGGGESSTASDINNYGQVVGQSESADGLKSFHPFLWTPNTSNGTTGSMMQIGSGSGVIFDTESTANRINNYGQVGGNIEGHPFLWTPSSTHGLTGTMSDLGVPTAEIASVQGINSIGQVVVDRNGSTFLWTPTTSNGVAGSQTNVANFSTAARMNDFGQIVFDSSTLIWTPTSPNSPDGAFTAMNDMPANLLQSQSHGVNASGQIVGGNVLTGVSGPQAFLWTPTTPNGSMGHRTDLGNLPNGGLDSQALGINDIGQIVGIGRDANSSIRAFLWTQSDGMVNLNGLLDSSGTGWSLGFANSINNLGQIVGDGFYDPDGPGGTPGVAHAFLLTPVPEPSSLIGSFSIAILSIRYRRGRYQSSLSRLLN
jgi:probable HAF family extracellular repeat protein